MKKIGILIILVLVIILLGIYILTAEKEPTAQNPGPENSQAETEEVLVEETDVKEPKQDNNKPIFPESVLLDASFIAQAPFGEWSNPVFQDGCEEASLITAVLWLENGSMTKEQAKAEIESVSDFELDKYGEYRDRSAKDTAQLMKDYYGYYNIEVKYDITKHDIISELRKGNMVITPMDGQLLKNPYYTAPGPERHMLPIIGYDAKTKEFITNDVGTQHGEHFRYPEDRLFNSIRDYETGYHIPIKGIRKTMIIVGALPKICFDNDCFLYETADTVSERQKGLMNRGKLNQNAGMLFVFEQTGRHDFWMKNTLIPLDIIWIGADKKVVDIKKNAQPCKYECQTLKSEADALYGLELNAGTVDKIGLKTGDKLEF